MDKCKSCKTGVLEYTAPSICTTTCPTGKVISGGECVPQSQVKSSGSSGDGWYVGAITVGVISMACYFAFLGFLMFKWPHKGEDPSPAQPPASVPPQQYQPHAAAQPAPNVPIGEGPAERGRPKESSQA